MQIPSTGWHALQDVEKDTSSVIPVTRPDGVLDPRWLPFGRGGFEFDRKFLVQGNPTIIDIMDLDHPEGYLIQLNNLTPSTNDVKLYMRFFDQTKNDWTGIQHWTILYANHLAGGLRDFNTDSDMMLADHVGSGKYGISGFIYLMGFGKSATNTIKVARGDLSYLSAVESFSSLTQSVGTFDRLTPNITGIRLYFNYGTFVDSGYVSTMIINDKN